ncbi:MAG: hypothetical protein C0432_05660 [Candidatus Puniceispirillum sp.]|nr:hypothetical protein [Candidatus Puniceispirillum sp.]
MKNIKNIISFLLMSIILISCEDKGLENVDWLKEPIFDVPMVLTPSSQDVVMKAGNDDAVAITFNWTAGNNRGTGTTLKYFFRMDIIGNNFEEATTLLEEIPAGVFTKSYTVGELNELLIEKWGYTGGSKAKLEAQIIAQVENSPQYQKPEVASTSFSATAFSQGPLPLFMVGDAVGSGWNYSLGIKMNEVIERSQYTYTGSFSVGSFKIIDNPGSEWPSYNPKDASTLVYNKTDPGTVTNFTVTTAGRYSLFVNRSKLTYIFGYTPYENIYMVGNAITGIGWDIGKAKQMTWDPKNPEVFSYKGQFDAGEFKLYTQQGNWNGRALMPPVNGTKLIVDGDATAMSLMPNANPDNKWVIETTGNYELIVNPAKMTIMLKKL